MKEENKNSFLSQHPYIGTMFYNFTKRLKEVLSVNEIKSVNNEKY
jgi:hypothetical protein